MWLAEDFDNAVAEWGRWVEGKIDEAMQAYIDSVHDGNKGKKDPTPVDKDEIRRVREEAWHRHVRQKIRRVFEAPDGKWVITKPITGDPLIDFENDHPNGTKVFIPDA